MEVSGRHNDMHDSATTMFMTSKMNGINGICAVYTVYTPTACVADPGAQNIAPKLSPGAQMDVRHIQQRDLSYSEEMISGESQATCTEGNCRSSCS